MTWFFEPLTPLAYDVIVIDPAWKFALRSAKGNLKSADRHYKTMTFDEIKAMPVGYLASRDSLLLLWTTGWAMATGMATEACRAWGFEPVTELAWRKTTINDKVRWGSGYRARSMHEPILLGKMGDPKHKAFPSVFDGLAREHSRKPEEFYAMVDKHTTGLRKADVFARQVRPGWEGFGDELGKFDFKEAAE